MDVITTHVNADFDAFASMVAAKKLYPDAAVAFPGSQEKNLRDFFMESTLYILSIERAKDIDLENVHRLILVDTRQKSRIGRFSTLGNRENVEIHIYDHHPDSEDDMHGHKETIREVGATVTILIEEIRKRRIEINAEEATVLALGIYEDTGSFTFSSTTKEDFEAAAWLLQKGANLNIVSNMMTSDLSRDQIEVLHQLIEESEIVNLGGIDVLVTTAGAEGYVGDLAILVHKYKDMENLDAIFAAVRMEDRVHLIARSSLEEVNVGEIVSEFGGGGHPTAASASVRNMTLFQVKDKLIAILKEKVRPKQKAREIMSRPAIVIEADKTILQASEYLNRYQISSLPVVQNGSVLGILHRNAVEKAVHHGLSAEPVNVYMNPGVMSVTPDDSIENVLQLTVEGRFRLVPVIEEGKLVGVISRSDLLEHMKLPRRSDSANPDEYPQTRLRGKSVRKLLEERLPRKVMDILRKAGQVGSARGEEVYLVGGAVRDLLLRNHNLDIDLVIEGQGILFARELAAQFPDCRVRSHEKFGTAVILFEDNFKIDVATARHEYYARPGALPTVETSSIKRDLFRRDFTMNTLAINLNTRTIGHLIDFFGGSRDIKERVIRVLHNLAFVEDPTRILRAIRFSSRFGFAIGKHALNLMKAAIRMKLFDKVEGKRLLNELIHMLEEKNPLSPLTLMEGYGIPQALHPALNFTPKIMELVESVIGVLSWWKYLFMKDQIDSWAVYFLALTDNLSDGDFKNVVERFSIVGDLERHMTSERILVRQALALFARGIIEKPSEIYSVLRNLSLETLLFMMAKTTREETRMAISEYIINYRYVKALLTGKDLIRMGYEPGPIFAPILRTLKQASLDREIFTRSEAEDLVRRIFPIKNKAADRDTISLDS